MADMLNSHPEIVLPAHENKLIVERDGLRDVVNQFSAPFDMKRNHYAVADFARWAKKLRNLGFRDPKLNEQVKALMNTQRMGFHRACEVVARENPGSEFSIHAVGHGFGFPHYDKCANDFIRGICLNISDAGIVDTEGLISPFITPKVMERDEILAASRTFLDSLYEPPLNRASASRWCDDTPSNWLYFDFLHELYPDMKFIHMIRDPRDVVGSYMKQVWAPSDPNVIVAIFKAQFAAYEAIKARVPADRVKEVRLEDITADRARVMSEVADFLGVENRFNVDLFFNEKVNTGTYANKVGEGSMGAIERELSDWMETHDYLS
jgi:hypothetical protein